MISYKRCLEASYESIYKAFKLGFSDYAVPMNLEIEDFISRFFGPEGNSLEHSFIAFDDELPIGIVLGGIRLFDGLKTMRCGTLCIEPDHRGKGIANKLMKLHIEEAKQKKCHRIFLEVIKTNERALSFYKNMGYNSMNDLKYFSIKVENLSIKPKEYIKFYEMGFDKIANYRNYLKDIHINWQSDIQCFENSTTHAYLIAMDSGKNAGYIVMSKKGKIEQLYVEHEYRCRGIATNLIAAAADKVKTESVSICLPNNSTLECFLIKSHFLKDKIEQFEMYRPL
ncbi:GNAT family N-acetyltransferase [Clostridium thailandense]|uniref:GNAT family N-acetyltransferase n=1 Tax=Clostridium thailandense TaxID=2794346 RepID=UPI003989787D